MIDLWGKLRERWLAAGTADLAAELPAHLRRDIGIGGDSGCSVGEIRFMREQSRDPVAKYIRYRHNRRARMHLQLHRADD